MAKVATKSENIISLGGIYHVMDVFSKLGFEKRCGIKVIFNLSALHIEYPACFWFKKSIS